MKLKFFLLVVTVISTVASVTFYLKLRECERRLAAVEVKGEEVKGEGVVTNAVAATSQTNQTSRITQTSQTNQTSRTAYVPPPTPPKPKEPVKLPPETAFVDYGRYLPPCGARTIALKSVNVSNVFATVWRVEPNNIVQLLAREEREYSSYYGGSGDSSDTIELSGESTETIFECHNEFNVKERHALPIAVDDGGCSNGVFLVSLDHVRVRENYYRKHRLVCVSDLGLSARTTTATTGVWVTSLTTGRPIEGAWVSVYSKSNIKIAEGRSDERGWCVPARVAKGEPFAIVALSPEADDMTFMALSPRMSVDETYPDGARDEYLAPEECTGFGWTERGIYRHDENIFYHLLLRDGTMKAPKPMPVRLLLLNPSGRIFAESTVMSDEFGAIACESFLVPGDQPSGKWTILAKLPGEHGAVLSRTVVKIEEFAPPQIRVKVATEAGVAPSNFAFTVSAEHLFGGPASSLVSEGAVVFEDAAFAPAKWKGYSFGDPKRGLKPNFYRLASCILDDEGRHRFDAPLQADDGQPEAMVRVTAQGVVFEDGGRPAAARETVLLHYYPYYIGSTLTSWMRRPQAAFPTLSLACVSPDGKRLAESRTLSLKLERIDYVYSYRQQYNGTCTWDCDCVRTVVTNNMPVVTMTDADTVVELPIAQCGDYEVSVLDTESGVGYSRQFYLSDWGDEEVRATLSDPTEVTVTCDQPHYRVGETPHLVVRSPFTGFAMMTVIRDCERYTEIFELTNATQEVVLRSVTRADAPNLDVFISVVQSVSANAKHLAARAHGLVTIPVCPVDCEVEVKLDATVNGCTNLSATVIAPGAERVVVTVVDEGINILTDERTPDPIAAFAKLRTSEHTLYDIYGRILPVAEDDLRASGLKTGGDVGAGMLGRVSPVPSRRFKPLALWQREIPVSNGVASASFALPEFVGEVRVTAVAYSAIATGAASVQRKVTPKIVSQPDAPRFVAPGDTFRLTMPLSNRAGREVTVVREVLRDGVVIATGPVTLADGESNRSHVSMVAPSEPGTVTLGVKVTGAGETHFTVIELPVRPAVAWVESAGVCRESEWTEPTEGKWSSKTFDSPLGEYEAALRWLAEYRYGCLEQTCSRVFPLIFAGGILNGVVTNSAEAVNYAVQRVESMMRESDFVMWPDSNYSPWDREVSVYAAHFLVSAKRAGYAVSDSVMSRVNYMLYRSAIYSKNDSESAYATLVLALAGDPEKDRMYRLFDKCSQLSALDRARLALAFAEIGDLGRANFLMAEAFEPQSVKEASFALQALVAIDPKSPRLLPLVTWLNSARDRAQYSWGTTAGNAHALMAIGAYYAANPPQKGEKFVSWRRLTLPEISEVKDESSGIFIERRFLNADGRPVDLNSVRRGELLLAELSITSSVTRVVNDLVIEDLFPGCLEPVHRELSRAELPFTASALIDDWVMRRDARDDRMLIFSKKFTLEAGRVARIVYPVRAVSAGDYVLPGPSVEGMYDPRLHARRAPGRIVVLD